MRCKVCGKRFKLQADRRYDVLKQSNPVCRPTQSGRIKRLIDQHYHRNKSLGRMRNGAKGTL